MTRSSHYLLLDLMSSVTCMPLSNWCCTRYNIMSWIQNKWVINYVMAENNVSKDLHLEMNDRLTVLGTATAFGNIPGNVLSRSLNGTCLTLNFYISIVVPFQTSYEEYSRVYSSVSWSQISCHLRLLRYLLHPHTRKLPQGKPCPKDQRNLQWLVSPFVQTYVQLLCLPSTLILVCKALAPSTLGNLRCTGWFSAWLVPVIETEVRMSKESLPSGWG